MNYKPIIIVAGEPNSIFFELFFKVIKKKIKSPIILIASKKLLLNQGKILKKKVRFNLINELNYNLIIGVNGFSTKNQKPYQEYSIGVNNGAR